jgi:hypothetical protein
MAKVTPRAAQPQREDPPVTVRVTLKGAGRVSNGVHHPMLGDEFYEQGEKFQVAASIALDLEERGFAEIEGPRPKAQPKPKEVETEAEWKG